jgi:hypothetical protein
MSYYDYIEKNTDDNSVYIVTWYGCNSTLSDLITPESMLFKNFRQAHEYFIKMSPDLDNKDCYAEQYIPKFNSSKINEKYVVIEVRVQTAGYHSGGFIDDRNDISYAKRPVGSVLARCQII